MNARSLLRISDLTDGEIFGLCEKALKNPPSASAVDPRRSAVALMFLEPSTRTRVSFERASQLVGRPTILFDDASTSLVKGESLEDTLLTLRALNISTFVIRTPHTGSLEKLRVLPGISVINAGDGVGEHPTQALLDATTLLDALGGDRSRFSGLRMGILGDLRRSRVARSWAELAPRLGVHLSFISPSGWRPQDWGTQIPWTDRKADALGSLDVIMALRVQKERMGPGEDKDTEAFIRSFRIHPLDLTDRQKLMHPGPVNWDVELSSEFQRDSRSLILTQVQKGLSLRACVLDLLGEAS